MGGNRSMGVWSIVVLLLSASTAAAQSAPLVNAVKNQDQATVRPLLEKSVNLDTDSLPTRTGARVNPGARTLTRRAYYGLTPG